MPADGFLQHFHNLALADPEARVRAALAIRRGLAAPRKGASEQDGGTPQENLQYTLRRLARGVQSSRQCARQGFSLALCEVLAAFPAELPGVVTLVRKETELQSGLKASEQKERLLGRLFAFAAVLEAGCLRRVSEGKASKGMRAMVAELGLGLQEIYTARPYMKDPASLLVAKACRELSAAGLAGLVPDVLGPFKLDEKLREGDEAADMHATALALDLRQAYLDAKQAGAPDGDLTAWPACVREERLTKPSAAERLAKGLGVALGSNPVSDAVPFALEPLCKWWLRVGAAKGLQEKVWPALDGALFPEKASPTLQAQGLRALSEFAARLAADAGGPGAPERAEAVLGGLFGQMPRGLALLLRTLCWPRAQAHAAAVGAQRRMLEAAGAGPPPPPPGAPKDQKGKGKGAAARASAAPAARLSDAARLAALEALQQHRAYGSMPGKFQRQWQEALLAPLAAPGVRKRCAALLATSADAGAQGAGAPDTRLWPAQLEALALHSKASDEVIVASMCRLLTAGYFEPEESAAEGVAFSLRAFMPSTKLAAQAAEEDMLVPVGLKGASDGVDGRKHWRLKLWSSLVGLVKRPSPEMAEKILAGSGVNGADADQGDAEPGAGTAGQAVRTYAFNGCLSDGSLLLSRLHQWWDHIVENGHETNAAPAVGSDKPPAKKRKKGAGTGAALRCIAPLSEEDLGLRKECVELCSRLLAEPEPAEGGLTVRQRNALCSLLLALALVLLDADDEEERDALRGQIKEVREVLSGLPAEAPADAPAKRRAKVQKARQEALAAVPRVAAELFTNSGGLVKEVTRMAWRELGDFTPDETISSICASVRDAGEDASGDEAEGDSDAGEDEATGAEAKRAAKLAQMTEELKAERAEEGTGTAAGGGDSDDADEIILEGDEVLQQLLGDGDDEGAGGSLMNMFAGSGLDGADVAESQKLSKRQQRLKQRQEELAHKFRELELLELYLSRFAAKRQISLQILVDLHKAMITATVRAKKNRGGGEANEQKSKNKKHKGRADSALRQLQDQLSQRISKLLTRALKQICRPAQIREVSGWCSPDEWAEHARQLLELAAGPQAAIAGQRPQAVGSQLLYFFCASHRAAVLGGAAASTEAGAGWSMAEELLGGVLRDWGSKKDGEGWCEAALGAFAFRAPEVLLRLPWLEHVRANKKVFAQRSQIAFISERLLRNLPPDVALGTAATALCQGFTGLCTELLEGTLSSSKGQDEAKDEGSASQRAKLRREGLRGLAVALKAGQKKGGDPPSGGPAADTKHVASVVARVRDSLPAKRGQVYQLCWDVLRRTGKPPAGKVAGAQEVAAESQKRARSDRDSEQSTTGKKRKTS